MAKIALEHFFNGTTQKYSVGYDSTKTLLGAYIDQYTGATALDKYAGPKKILIGRPMEASTAIATAYPYVIQIGTKNLIFLGENSSASTTRRIVLYEHDTVAQTLVWKGFITLTYPTATNHTIRDIVVTRHTHTTGTVSCSATTALTGSSTLFTTDRIGAGARIGFGSTDPASITTWYSIASITDNTNLTLGSTGPTISGVSYVIEEYRIYTITTNATAANGGLYVAKGINYNNFSGAGTTISAATSTDNLKAVYWLADASTVLNTACGGMGVDTSSISATNTTIYVTNVDASTTLRIYKYNGRASLSGLSSGKSTSSFVYRTGQQTVTGTIAQIGSATLATPSHGVGSGVSSLYVTTSSRILRCLESGITDASTTFVVDTMSENPTGGTNTFAVTGGMNHIAYSSYFDMFTIGCGALGRPYLTKYVDGSSSDYVMQVRTFQGDQSSVESNGDHPQTPDICSNGCSYRPIDGYFIINKNGTGSLTNQIYVVPIGADWSIAVGTSSSNQNRLITPSLSLTNCQSLQRVYVSAKTLYGTSVLGLQPEPYRVYYRTSGISDNSGSWILISETGDISGGGSASNIQFMVEFRAMGAFSLPARIYSITCLYENNQTDSHYQPSQAFSDRANKRFAWRFSTAFGGTVPTLYIRIYEAITGSLLLTDDTATPDGTWQKSTDDGQTWGSYNTTDQSNNTTYIRYTPTSLADNTKVTAVLSQA